MFKKEESSKVAKVAINKKLNLKKIGAYLITLTLLNMYAIPAKADDSLKNHFDFENSKMSYYDRLEKLSKEGSYNQNITNLYHYGQLLIDQQLYPIDKFYVAYKQVNEGYEFHLMCIGSGYKDILNKSLEDYDFDGVIKLRDTTVFIELIEHPDMVIDYANNIIVVKNDILQDMITNWDGMIHDRVSDTDAIEHKDILNRRSK